jgi:hypothetical protein
VSSGTLPPVPSVPSTFSTVDEVVSDSEPVEQVEVGVFDWMYEVSDVDVSPDGSVYVVGGIGVASLDGEGEWVLLDIDGLPEGTGLDDGWPGRIVEQVAIGPDGTVWLAGMASSHADDEKFGGYIDGWSGGRFLYWVARYHCPLCGEWTVWTTNRVPELADGIGDLVVAGDGTLYASMDGTLLLVFDGTRWESHRLPTGWLWSGDPWSASITVGTDGVLWAAKSGSGLIAFDGADFTERAIDDILLDDVYQVTAGADGTIWVATDTEGSDPAEAAGVAAFDGTSWTSYTTSDGLLSNHAVIATGSDGTVWAVHSEIPPYGYSKFDGTSWTAYPFNHPVGGFQAGVGPDGILWTVSEEGLVSFDGITRTVHPSPFVRPDGSFTFTPLQWGVTLNDSGPGTHLVFMIVDVRPLTTNDVEDVSGRLIWEGTVVDLCTIHIRQERVGFLHFGDIFGTDEGCESNPTAMKDAFDEFGLPETACLTVTVGGDDHEYCAPLPIVNDSSVGSEPGTVTVSLEGLEGFEGLAVDAWVVPLEPTEEWQRLGGTGFWPINQDPVFASDVIHPQGERYFDLVDGEAATFAPGTYRFIIEAYVPSGNMRYGCEMPIQVVEDEPLIVTLSSIPTYTESGIHWTPLDELEYPDCPN